MPQDIEDPKLGIAWRRDDRTGLVSHQVPRMGARSAQPVPIIDPGFLPYVPGRFYAAHPAGPLAVGAAAAGPLVRFIPLVIRQRCTIDQLVSRVTTAQAGTNYQLAIYANNYDTQRPTGRPLGQTANISSASAARNATALAAEVTLDPGVYWLAHNTDATTAVWQVTAPASTNLSLLIGGDAAAVNNANAVSITGLSTAGTFGTWGDVTGSTFTEISGGDVFFAFYRVSALA